MDQATADRLRVKHPENTLSQQLSEQVGTSPAQTEKIIEIVVAWATKTYSNSRPCGQIVRTVVIATEPAGKPITHCQTCEVHLTVDHKDDLGILKAYGSVALRGARILRLSWEAYEQKAVLSYEDLAAILCLDRGTVSRQVRHLRKLGLVVPTRGLLQDMGRAPSHKAQIGRLLCRGYIYTEITALTGHSERSIERYALDLGRIIALCDMGTPPNDTRIISELTEKAVEIYVGLYQEHNVEEFRSHLDKLKRRFESGKGIVGPGQYPPKPPQNPSKRLREQTYEHALSQLMQQHLALTPAIADGVVEKIVALETQLFPDRDQLTPGQTILLVDSAASAPKYSGNTSGDRPLVPVILSPWTQDKIDILTSSRPLKERRALIADALAREAKAQGGTMSVSCLAFLLSTSPAAMATALAELRLQQDDPTPIKGITEDAGATLTHKGIICDLQDLGYTPPEISIITCHEPDSRDRYLKANLRVETLIKVLGHIPDEVQTARFLGMQKSVTKQYLDRLRRKLAAEETPEAAAQPSAQHGSAAPSGHQAVPG